MGILGKLFDFLLSDDIVDEKTTEEKSGTEKPVENVVKKEKLDFDNLKYGTFKGEPIFWKPFKGHRSDSGGMVYVAAKPLFWRAFNQFDSSKRAEVNIWKTSTLREYLNGEFYETCFSEDEKKHILAVNTEAFGNTVRDAYGRKTIVKVRTMDNVSLPPSSIKRYSNFHCGGSYWTRDACVKYRNKDSMWNLIICTKDEETCADGMEDSDWLRNGKHIS